MSVTEKLLPSEKLPKGRKNMLSLLYITSLILAFAGRSALSGLSGVALVFGETLLLFLTLLFPGIFYLSGFLGREAKVGFCRFHPRFFLAALLFSASLFALNAGLSLCFEHSLGDFSLFWFAPQSNVMTLSTAVVSLFFSSFCEEFFCRGVMLSESEGCNVGFVLLFAGLFSAMYRFSFISLLFLLPFGMVAGWMRTKSGSFLPGLLMSLAVKSGYFYLLTPSLRFLKANMSFYGGIALCGIMFLLLLLLGLKVGAVKAQENAIFTGWHPDRDVRFLNMPLLSCGVFLYFGVSLLSYLGMY